jgi:leucyl aminopeptidase
MRNSATATIAALKLPVHLVTAIGLVENMTGPAAYKLGDVITARSGTTIEVHNTDAEGRVVLADVLDVIRGYKPKRVIDAATLGGGAREQVADFFIRHGLSIAQTLRVRQIDKCVECGSPG